MANFNPSDRYIYIYMCIYNIFKVSYTLVCVQTCNAQISSISKSSLLSNFWGCLFTHSIAVALRIMPYLRFGSSRGLDRVQLLELDDHSVCCHVSHVFQDVAESIQDDLLLLPLCLIEEPVFRKRVRVLL